MQWSPRPFESGLAATVGIALLLVVIGLDTAGRLLVGATGVLLLALALSDVLVRPRLRADSEGLTVRTLVRRVGGPWAGIAIRVRTGRRLGARAHTLEIDIGEELVVLGRRELGADPVSVAEDLRRLSER